MASYIDIYSLANWPDFQHKSAGMSKMETNKGGLISSVLMTSIGYGGGTISREYGKYRKASTFDEVFIRKLLHAPIRIREFDQSQFLCIHIV